MKQRNRWILPGVICVGLLAVMSKANGGDIDPSNKTAWAESVGWINFASTNADVTVDAGTCLSGYAWVENIGWIKLGNDSGGPYQNTGSNNWGVNLQEDGKLSGYAWSESAGWINFHPSNSQVVVDRNTGCFEGYAWGENIGWIHFQSTNAPESAAYYSVKTTRTFKRGTLLSIY